MRIEVRVRVTSDAKGVRAQVDYLEEGKHIMTRTRTRRWNENDPRELDQNFMMALLTEVDNCVADWQNQQILF